MRAPCGRGRPCTSPPPDDGGDRQAADRCESDADRPDRRSAGARVRPRAERAPGSAVVGERPSLGRSDAALSWRRRTRAVGTTHLSIRALGLRRAGRLLDESRRAGPRAFSRTRRLPLLVLVLALVRAGGLVRCGVRRTSRRADGGCAQTGLILRSLRAHRGSPSRGPVACGRGWSIRGIRGRRGGGWCSGVGRTALRRVRAGWRPIVGVLGARFPRRGRRVVGAGRELPCSQVGLRTTSLRDAGEGIQRQHRHSQDQTYPPRPQSAPPPQHGAAGYRAAADLATGSRAMCFPSLLDRPRCAVPCAVERVDRGDME